MQKRPSASRGPTTRQRRSPDVDAAELAAYFDRDPEVDVVGC